MKIVADVHIPFVKEYFSAYGEVILKAGRTISRADVVDADILLVRSVTHVDETLLADTQVKFVGSVTAGADHLDIKWLEEAGIVWSVATGFNAPPVADYVVSVIAALQRKAILKPEAKVAIVGIGNVGRLVVSRLQQINMDVILCDPVRAELEPTFVSTPIETLSDVDLISLHVPLTKGGKHPTYHFIDKDFLLRQKPGCVLLNACRGSVIDSKVLMEHGKHLHWCFDVFEHEPKIDKSLLENTLIATPHIAGYSLQSKIRGIDMIYRIAVQKKIIPPQAFAPLTMPKQDLSFAGDKHHWQDLVLGVFNPLIITAMMRTQLLPATDYGRLFDEMRNQFNYRYEFGYTHVLAEGLLEKEKAVLEKLGLTVN